MEMWKKYPANDFYEISNLGNVRSVDRYVKGRGENNLQFKKGVMLKFTPDKNGYSTVRICREGKPRTSHVHKLVALTFLPNEMNFPCVNHKNEIKTDNSVQNLEWCTWQYNATYNGKHLRQSAKFSVKRYQYDLEGNLIKIWNSARECKEYGYTPSQISQCCTGKAKTHKGYVWSYFNC